MSRSRLRSNTLDSRDAALGAQLQNHGVHRLRSKSLSRKPTLSTPSPKITISSDAPRSHQLDWHSSFSSDSLDEGSTGSHISLRTTRRIPGRTSPNIVKDAASNTDVGSHLSGLSPGARSDTDARYGRRSPSPLQSPTASPDNSLSPSNTPWYPATELPLASRLSLSPSSQLSRASVPSSPVYVPRGQQNAVSACPTFYSIPAKLAHFSGLGLNGGAAIHPLDPFTKNQECRCECDR